jgi:glycosyltransferase involved in cell wall biosynthesis
MQNLKPHPFFSIIVPVFKTEAYLQECLESIKSQTFTDFECFVVNDGSPGPESGLIFEKIVGSDLRFGLINKENAGVSSARNRGLEKVSGKWLLQIDSDDWVTPEHLTSFYDKLKTFELESDANKKLPNKLPKKLPIVRFILSEFYNTKVPLHTYLPKELTLGNIIHSCTLMNVNYAINLAIVKKYNLKFDERLGRGSKLETRISNGGEDFLFGFQYLSAVEAEFGVGGFELIPISDKTYKYREVQTVQKSIEDDLGPYKYAKYFQQFGYQNPRLSIKIITFILPFWVRLRFYKNPFATFLRKVLSFFLRLISG